MLKPGKAAFAGMFAKASLHLSVLFKSHLVWALSFSVWLWTNHFTSLIPFFTGKMKNAGRMIFKLFYI